MCGCRKEAGTVFTKCSEHRGDRGQNKGQTTSSSTRTGKLNTGVPLNLLGTWDKVCNFSLGARTLCFLFVGYLFF